jgi:siroheme synthase (precorrin-2 oxidase/ferrochelatase)
VVAVATGGHSPALATWLRRRLEAELGPEVAVLAALLGEARSRVKVSGRSTEDLDWQALLDAPLLDVLVSEGEDAARARIDAWLETP